MTIQVVLGVDIGTSSSKGVLVALDGRILAQTSRDHSVDRPHPGHVEMDATVWTEDFDSIARELSAVPDTLIAAVGVSGMGPCALVTDEHDIPLRPAILYGVDSRATEQIARLEEELGSEAIVARGKSSLSSQAVGPKLAWIAEHEPAIAASARRLYMPSSWLVRRLTGEYVLDHHSASQCWPLYDVDAEAWYQPWASVICPGIDLPPLRWPGEAAGTVSDEASASTGIPAGVPVVTGTIDAWAEAVSVGAVRPGDLMLMYGTTMFLVNTVSEAISSPSLWTTAGAYPGTRSLAGGMATSGAITAWLRDLLPGSDFAELTERARASGPGARGLLMLPYFAGERTPVQDPSARGVIAGLTLTHDGGDLYRAALEATAFGVRHNIATMREAGGTIERIVAVGGGTQGGLWTSIVSDVTGVEQIIPTVTIGASFGGAFLAASLVAQVDIEEWNPAADIRVPDPTGAALYEDLFRSYLELYPATSSIVHRLARLNEAASIRHTPEENPS
jgi:xylulokinase